MLMNLKWIESGRCPVVELELSQNVQCQRVSSFSVQQVTVMRSLTLISCF